MSDNMIRSAIEVITHIQNDTLQGAHVSEIDLSKHGLPNANAVDTTFRRIALHDADARDGVYSRSRFTECSCRQVHFDRSLFRGASFFNSELIEASFKGAMLSGSSFFSCRLGNADFSAARIQSSTFNSCELFGAKFNRSLILNSKFEAQERGNVTLDRADFSNAVIIDCDLAGANLFGANFQNALLIKVDLRHANIAQANFEGARLVDVQIDLSLFEPGERRMIEAARLHDPWRNHGFMKEVLAPYSGEEVGAMLEYLLRTYVIESAEPTADADSFTGLMQSIKARHDFPELEKIRIRNGGIQVQLGTQWHDLGAPVQGAVALPTPGQDEPDLPTPTAPSEPEFPTRPAAPRGIDFGDAAPKPVSNTPPPKVTTSKRFRKLELD